MAITIEVDKENDQLYLLLRDEGAEAGSVARSIRLSDDVVADLDAEGNLLGLDLGRASTLLGIDVLDRLVVTVNWLG